ncbi:MAG: hypothetical protein IIC64_08735 [SAR324 cluster bacterium]|nr:hypothetical protein [SAR324 cluster bacterium]
MKIPLVLGSIKVMPSHPAAEASFGERDAAPEAMEWGGIPSLNGEGRLHTGPAGSINESGEGKCVG